LESGTDQDFSIGDTIAAFVTSQALEDIHDSALATLENSIRDVTSYGAIGDGWPMTRQRSRLQSTRLDVA
jgi:hypothetical protein